MRRPRASLVSLRSGGFGTRSGGTTTAPQGACWTGIGAKRLVPGNADPGSEIAAVERRGASVPIARRAPPQGG